MAFNTAISGLNAAATELNVIGHNVANASTTGFKSSRVEFADIFPSSSLGTSANAVGRGVQVSAVDQQFTQGNVNFTGSSLDLAISGQGFFILSDNGTRVYSRAGGFGVDRDGYVVNNSNQRLQVYQADASGNISGAIGDLYLDPTDIAPSATTSINAGLNLNANSPVLAGAIDPNDPTTYTNSTALTVYDSLGNAHNATVYFQKTGANTWNAELYVGGNQAAFGAGTNTLTFQSDGSLNTAGNTSTAFTITGAQLGNGAAALNVTVDFNSTTPITQYGSNFSVNNLTQDGFTTGRLRGIDISDTGVVLARYTNGQSRTLAQVALANFNNPQGLRQLGDTSWAESFESGAALVGSPGTASLGLVQSGALEDSNVNLTEELVAMITAQRNFQANAQAISTEDAITQTIINIR
jgi:flagellar hook protein FlgE